MYRIQKGFTLIEMLIVVAIVAILAALANASYQGSVQKSRRADGKDALSRAAALQEKYYLGNNYKYTIDTSLLGGAQSPEGYYAISAAFTISGPGDCNEDDDQRCFTITATAQGAQLNDTNCTTLTIDNLGRRAAKASDDTDTTDVCW